MFQPIKSKEMIHPSPLKQFKFFRESHFNFKNLNTSRLPGFLSSHLRLKGHFVLLLLPFLFLSACGLKTARLLKKGEVEQQEFYKTLSFQTVGSLMVFEVEVNGVPARFLFDSGAPNVISPALYEKLKLKAVSSTTVKDSGGNKEKQEFVLLDSMSMGGVKFYNTLAAVVSLNSNDALACLNIDGIFGANAMRLAFWEMNSQKKEMTITNDISKLGDLSGMQVMNFTPKNSGSPKVEVSLNGLPVGYVTFDTGSNGHLDVPKSFAKLVPKTSQEKSTLTEVGATSFGVFGLGQGDTTFYRVIDTVRLGGSFELKTKIVEFRGNANLLGMKVLENYRVIFDWQSNKIYLEEQVPYLFQTMKSYGFGYVLQNNELTVGSVYLGSAADGKLQIGDRILEMGTTNLEGKNEVFFCPFMFEKKDSDYFGERVMMKIKRGESIMEVELDYRRFFE